MFFGVNASAQQYSPISVNNDVQVNWDVADGYGSQPTVPQMLSPNVARSREHIAMPGGDLIYPETRPHSAFLAGNQFSSNGNGGSYDDGYETVVIDGAGEGGIPSQSQFYGVPGVNANAASYDDGANQRIALQQPEPTSTPRAKPAAPAPSSAPAPVASNAPTPLTKPEQDVAASEPETTAAPVSAPAAPAAPEPAQQVAQNSTPDPEPSAPAPAAPPVTTETAQVEAPEPAPLPSTDSAPEPAPSAPAIDPVEDESAVPVPPAPSPDTTTPAPELPSTTPEPAPEPEPEPAPAPSAPAEEGALPPETSTAPASTASGGGEYSLGFGAESFEVSDAAKRQLDSVIAEMSQQEDLRIQLQAYAQGDGANASKARRLSLSRALQVRSYLIDQGVRSTRIDVRALGANVPSGPADRVDIKTVQR